jgi:hypothetical protein
MDGQENEILLPLINKNLNKSLLQSDDITSATYKSDCLISEDFLEIKDMFYQVLQCLGGVLGSSILPH